MENWVLSEFEKIYPSGKDTRSKIVERKIFEGIVPTGEEMPSWRKDLPKE